MSLHRSPLSTRHLFIALLVGGTLFSDAFLAYSSIQRLIQNEQLLARSFETLGEIEVVETLARDMETSVRSFALTRDSRALEPFTRAKEQLPGAILALESNTSDAEQARRAETLGGQLEGQAALATQKIALFRKTGAQNLVGELTRQADETRRLAQAMRARESELLESRSLESRDSAQDANRTFWIASAANLAFLVLIGVLLWRAGVQNARLGRAYSDLKRAEELRDNLSAMLVHDLRTPLTSLLGPLALLRAESLGPLDASQKEVVTLSFQSGQRLLGLVNELLDLAKMEAGQFKLNREITPLRPLLERAIQNVRGLEVDGGAPMRIEKIEVEALSLDPALWERVLINLLGNAQKFTPENGEITLGVEKISGSNRSARFYVQDTGEGIPPEFQTKIFEKYGQVETRTAGKKFSTGLGLTFCQLAARAHGGEIGVSSEVGKGARFWIEI